jgi:hypothetical protein
MEQNKWIDISNAFNPMEPVPPNKLHEWFVSRPDSPIELLVNKLSPKRLPERYILVGQPASGKSSELTKLAAELENRYKDTLIVRFDIAVITDILEANPVEVIFLMGASVFKAAKESKLNPDKQLLENLTQGLETIVQTYTGNKDFKINLEKLLEGLEGLIAFSAKLIGAPDVSLPSFFKGFFRFTSGINKEIVRKLEVEPKIETMLESLNAIIKDIGNKSGGNRPILLVDGLDKLRDMDTIKLMFVEKQFLNRPNCSVVYIGPLDLYYSSEVGSARQGFRISTYSNIKIFSRDERNKLDEKGKQIMTAVVSKRLNDLKLNPEEIIADDALEMLIRGSGGVMRDFIRLIQDAATYAEINENKRITSNEAKKVLNELRRQLTAQLTPNYKSVLETVRTNKDRTGDTKCDDLLRNNIVLSYVNDDIWYYSHSALTDKPW